jgi:hypothetical protein
MYGDLDTAHYLAEAAFMAAAYLTRLDGRAMQVLDWLITEKLETVGAILAECRERKPPTAKVSESTTQRPDHDGRQRESAAVLLERLNAAARE